MNTTQLQAPQETQQAEQQPIGYRLDARAYRVAEPTNKTVGYATLNINNEFALTGIRIINGEKGLFASMPQAKNQSINGGYEDTYFPISRQARDLVNQAVLGAYENAPSAPQTRDGAQGYGEYSVSNGKEPGFGVDVRVYPNEQPGNNLAFATLNINNAFVIRGIHVMDGKNGKFVTMPQKKDYEGNYKDVCYPVTAQARQLIQDVTLGAYNNVPLEVSLTRALNTPLQPQTKSGTLEQSAEALPDDPVKPGAVVEKAAKTEGKSKPAKNETER
jgi:stage V sporulation protein G